MSFSRQPIGHGLGLRPPHFEQLLAGPSPVDWFEVISENFMWQGGRPALVLEKVRRDVPVALHGVSLSLGGSDPLSKDYLCELRSLADRIEPVWISDHLCWGTFKGRYAHDLLPLPYTEEAIALVVDRIRTVQDVLRRQILIENVSSYVGFTASRMTECEFLSEIAERADCGILLDVNNVVVSAFNHRFPPLDYLAGLPADRIGQIHLAGHEDRGSYLFDSHGEAVPANVWTLYAEAVRRFGAVPTLIERDDNIPSLEVLVDESKRAAEIEAEVLREAR